MNIFGFSYSYSFEAKSVTFNDSGKITVSGNIQDGNYKKATNVTIDSILLQKFPRGLGLVFPDVQELTISTCGLKQISRGDFADFKNLVGLNLNGNKIMQVPVDVFFDLKSLKRLSLADNLVMFIDINMFGDLDNLETFELNSDKYYHLMSNKNRVSMMKKFARNYVAAPGLIFPAALPIIPVSEKLY